MSHFEKNMIFLVISHVCTLLQYGLWSFQTEGTKLERFLPKNQHTIPADLFEGSLKVTPPKEYKKYMVSTNL